MERETRRAAEGRWTGYLPVAVFLVSSAVLLFWWNDLTAAQRRTVDEHFRSDARRVATGISERLDAYDQILRGAAGLFAASGSVTREEFHRYVEALQIGKAYKGIQGIGFVAWIPPGSTSVVYLEPPDDRNRRAIGLDGYQEPIRREAMESARSRGEVATSGKVTLVQETGTDVQPGILTFLPVYAGGGASPGEPGPRPAILGWVYCPLRMRDLMQGILGTDPSTLRVEIFDGSVAEPGGLLYDNLPDGGVAPLFRVDLPLQVNQRSWTLRFTAGEQFLAVARPRNPWVEFAAMAFIAFLVTGLSVALSASRRARLREADLFRSLRESEARYRVIFERAPVGIFTVDPADRFLTVNPRYCEITGWSRDELLGMNRWDIVHPDDRRIDGELARQIRSGERAAGTIERRGIRKDGTVFWAAVTMSLDAAGAPANLVGVLDDVTARREAEDKFRIIAERSVAGILIVQDGRIAYANPAMGEIAGYAPTELAGMTGEVAKSSILDEDRPLVSAAEAEAGGRVAGTLHPVTYRVVRPGGAVRRVTQMARSVQHLGRPATLVTILDVTDQARAEEEVRKAQRLEALGLVAGGIAHDFNNLLTAIFGQVELARSQVAPDAPAARELDVALSALARSRDLTRQLLTFATGGEPALKILPVARLVEDAVRLGLGGSSLRPVLDLAPDLPPVEADEGQMSQLLNNLLVNARQATPGAGIVTVRARRRRLGAGELPPLPEGAYVQIAIEDTGHGIPETILSRVFDPFFTTRSTGTGLGLATSYSIVRRHGGHISIASRVGEGTTVTILLPAADGKAAEPAAESARPAPAARLSVLLMDDEPLVLKVGARHLRKLGYEVETATTGEEAVEAHRRRWAAGAAHDVVILDLTVPGGMGGAEALERIREIDPGVVAIACSGYFQDGIMADPGKFGFAGTLGKPYLGVDMERVLASVAPRPP